MKSINTELLSTLIIRVFVAILLSCGLYAQEADSVKTMFGPNMKIGYIWSPELKINSIQDDTGTLISLSGGALFKRSVLLGLAIGANVGHPKVNYSYLGLLGQYTHEPFELIHASGQLLIGAADIKE